MFASTSERNDDGLVASYNISLLIMKSGEPHTIGEQLILPPIEDVLKTVLRKSLFDILKKISLSNNTVQRRFDEISPDIESVYVIIFKKLIFLFNWTSQPNPVMKHYYWHMSDLLWTKKFMKSYYLQKL